MILAGSVILTACAIFGASYACNRGIHKNINHFIKIDAEAEERHHQRQLKRDWQKYKAKPAYQNLLKGHMDDVSVIGSFYDANRGRSVIVGIQICADDARTKIENFINENALDVEILGHNQITEHDITYGYGEFSFYLHGKAAHVYEIVMQPEFQVKNSRRLTRNTIEGHNGSDPIFNRQLKKAGLING